MIISLDPLGIRNDLKQFKNKIDSTLPSSNQNDFNLLVSIFKHSVLYNILITSNPSINHGKYIRCMIYDTLNCIIAIIHKRERSLQLNIRSIIEHIARIALNKIYQGNDYDGTVRRNDFIFLKQEKSNENWKYMHDSYIHACRYVHLSPNTNLNIMSTFVDLLSSDCYTKISSQIVNLQRVISEITKIFLVYFESEISNTFLRTQQELKFLLGKSIYFKYLTIKNHNSGNTQPTPLIHIM